MSKGTDRAWIDAPPEWRVVESQGHGRFTTRQVYELPDGTRLEWSSRDHRLGRPPKADGPARVQTSRRTSIFTHVVAAGFALGAGLFVAGAALAQWELTGEKTIGWVYFAGGIFFTTSAYISILQLLNADDRLEEGSARSSGWRWWATERSRIDWVAAAFLFAGTLVFGANLTFALIPSLSPFSEDVLVWTPDVVGCLLFLASGRLEIHEFTHGQGLRHVPRGIAWWVVGLNMLGSVLFMAAAVGSYTRLYGGHALSPDLANVGTLLGAACFMVAAALMPLQLKRG